MAIGTTKVGTLATNAGTGPATAGYPGTVAAGDTVAAVFTGRGSISSITFITGWTRIGSVQQGTSTYLAVFIKDTRYAAGDASFFCSATGATGVGAFTMSWAGARRVIDSLTVPTGSGTTTTMNAPAVTTRTPGALAVNAYASADDQAHGTAGGGSTAVASGAGYVSTAGNDFAMSAAVESIAVPGSSGTNTMSHASGADNAYGSLTFALQPSVTVTGTVGAPLGELSSSVPNGDVDPVRGTSAIPLGALTVATSGTRTAFGSAGPNLGTLTATAVGIRTTFGSASVSLGELRGNVTGGSVTALGGGDISLNPSVWLVDRPSQILSPITGWTRLELSPVAGQPGDVGISLAVNTPGFADIAGLVSASPQTDAEIEIWLNGNGRGNGRLRAILQQKQGDDLSPENVWSFSGHFLEQLLAEVLVGVADTESKETFFDGENPGTILATIFDRIQARSPLLLAGMTRDFTTEYDSQGQLWETVLGTMKYTPDTSLLEVAQDLMGLATCEFEVTANRVFRVFNFDSRGVDHTVGTAPMRFQHGSNLRTASRRESSRVGEAATAVLGKGGDGVYAYAVDATAEAQRGRRVEAPTDVGRLTSQAAVLAGAEARLFVLKTGVQERAHSLAFTPGAPIPLLDFNLGDYAMSVAGDRRFERMRIQQWKLIFEPGEVTGDVVMNDLVQDWENLTEARLNAIQRGSTVVGTSPSPPQVDDGKSPRAPFGVIANSLAYIDVNSGATFAAVTMAWSPVTTNADGTALDDMAFYTPQFSYADEQGLPTGWQSLPTVQHPTTQIDFSAAAGVQVLVRVAAVDRYSNVGALSGSYAFTTAADALAPPTPSVPAVDSYLGILRVVWDGKGSAGERMPLDFQRVEVHVSTGEDFTPSRPLNGDGSLDERASTTFHDALTGAGDRGISLGTYDIVYYVKLVAVDRSHNASAASLAGSATLVQVGDDDIAEVNIGKLRTGFLTAIMTVSNTIRTAATGSRVELDSNGIRCFFGNKKMFDFSIPTGAMEMFGKLTAGAGVGQGPTVIVDPNTSSVRKYPDTTGNFYEDIAWVSPDGVVWEVRYSSPTQTYAGTRMFMGPERVYLDRDVSNPASSRLDLSEGLSELTSEGALNVSSVANMDISTTGLLFVNTPGNQILISADANNYLQIDSGIATLVQNGAVKAFVIQHPLDPDRFLVHGCTESPDAEVTYRGTVEIQNHRADVELPSYFEALVRADSRSAEAWYQLPDDEDFERLPPRRDGPALTTPIERMYRAAASTPRDGRFRITSDAPDGTVVHWRVTAARREAGGFVVEPLKADVEVRGDGPYRYIVPGEPTGKGP